MTKTIDFVACISSFLLSGFLVSACAETTETTSKVVFGSSSPNLQIAPVIVAMQEGYFSAEGLEVETVNFASGRRGLEALLGGQVDMAFMAELPPVLASLQDQEFGVVAEISEYTGNRIISSADVGFNSVRDLDGKRIGTTVGSNTEFFTDLLIKQAGIKAEVINVTPSEIVPTLVRGDIDAGVTFPDYYSSAKEVLGDKYREEIGADYTAYHVVAASTEMINERQDEVEKFLSALIKAEEFMRLNPEAAQTAIVEASQGTMNMEYVKASWPFYKYRIGLHEDFLNTMLQQAEWAISKGNVNKTTDVPATIRQRIADEPMATVDPSRVTID